MTDSQILDDIEKTLRLSWMEFDPDHRYSAYAMEMVEGFWRGYLLALCKERDGNQNQVVYTSEHLGCSC